LLVTVAPIILTFGTLAAVLVAVEIGRLVIRPRGRDGAPSVRIRREREEPPIPLA